VKKRSKKIDHTESSVSIIKENKENGGENININTYIKSIRSKHERPKQEKKILYIFFYLADHIRPSSYFFFFPPPHLSTCFIFIPRSSTVILLLFLRRRMPETTISPDLGLAFSVSMGRGMTLVKSKKKSVHAFLN
jgi:hypothetical protein